MKISCIIPTYNEKENLEAIFQELDRVNLPDYEVIFVDDSSPDGTGELLAEKAKYDSRIRLISRESKQGLGSAYYRGLCEATGDVLVVLEADFSAGISYIPKMLTEIKDGAGQVICSRYIKGSKSHLKFPKKQGSFFLNTLAGKYLGVPAKDLSIALRTIQSKYFYEVKSKVSFFGHPDFFTQLTYFLYKSGARIKEIPVIFEARIHGDSKNTGMVGMAFKYLMKLPKIKRSW